MDATPTRDLETARHAPLSLTGFVAVLACLMSLNALATDIMLPAFPDIALSLGNISVTRVQAVITAYLIGFAISQAVVGFLSDWLGRRPVLLVGLVIYVAASAATALSGDFSHLLLARLVQGIGSGAPRVIATAAVRDCYEGRRMAKVMSLTMTVFMAVPIIAPALGQGILELSNWRWVLGSVAIFGGVILAVTWFWFPETLPPESRNPISFARIGAALGSIIRSRQTVGYALSAGAFFGALIGFIGQSQQVMVDVFGLGLWFPLVFAGLALALSASSFINSSLVERLGMRLLSHAAVICFTVFSSLMLALSLAGLLSFWVFAPIHSANMLLVGIVFANFNAMAMEPQGKFAGVASSFVGAMTVAVGASTGFFISSHFDGTTTPMAAGLAISGFATLVLILITEKGRLFRGVHQRPRNR